jgi:3-oxoacyl-[acyl-carrier-protein] synthase II
MNPLKDNIVVNGIGWLDAQAWGGVLRRQRTAAGVPLWKRTDFFAYPVKNLGRCDAGSRMTLCACALALKDAGMAYSEGHGTGMGLIGTNKAGSLEANRLYFGDYLQAGRVLARGNLFVYTLPSSPLAEAAIHFGFQGPMLYMGFPGGGLGDLLEAGARLVADGAAGMVAVMSDEQEAMAFVLGQAGTTRNVERHRVADATAEFGRSRTGVGELALRLEKAIDGTDA